MNITFFRKISAIIITKNCGFVKKKRSGGIAAAKDYFLRKDLQSVHWSIAGFCSWVPTRIRSREQ